MPPPAVAAAAAQSAKTALKASSEEKSRNVVVVYLPIEATPTPGVEVLRRIFAESPEIALGCCARARNALYDDYSDSEHNAHAEADGAPTHKVVNVYVDPHMDGVAHTSGASVTLSAKYFARYREKDLDADNKDPMAEAIHELLGVLVHEFVHVWQRSASGTPWYLIEGVADAVRLGEALAPPHWRFDKAPPSWDVGYDGTARFLDFVGTKHYATQRTCDFIRRLNAELGTTAWDGKKDDSNDATTANALFVRLVGVTLEDLWREYVASFPK